MLNEDDPLYSAKKALNEAKESLEALKRLNAEMRHGFEWKVVDKKSFSVETQKMLQNSRNNIEKMKELSRKLRRL